ncbi:MAG: hypothetical protein L3J82_06700 [Planctomycetes bacterium]|nr:hypothetical protein [Planctomycetota bacterium]
MKSILAIVILFCLPLAAQETGRIDGTVKDLIGEKTNFADGTEVLAITLAEGSPPFNELIEGDWQSAMNLLYAGENNIPFGGIEGDILARPAGSAQVETDGRFTLSNLPLEQRLGVAVLVQGLWWPLREEVWLTKDLPDTTIELTFYTTTDDATEVSIVEHKIEVASNIRADLKYAALQIFETIIFENTNPYAAYFGGEDSDLTRLQIAVPPGITSKQAIDFYGTQWMYAIGAPNVNTASPENAENPKPGSWIFGRANVMHGTKGEWGTGSQFSEDNWHVLNGSGDLSFTGTGSTIYEMDMEAGPRVAYLRFQRIVPPAIDGVPGRLVIKVLHSSGIPYRALDSQFRLKRQFGFTVKSARAELDPAIRLAALIPGGHRAVYKETVSGHGMTAKVSDPDGVAMNAGEIAEFVFGLSDYGVFAATKFVDPDSAKQPAAKLAPEDKAGGAFDMKMMFKFFAAVFGLAFLIVFVNGLSKPRDEQRKKLNEAPEDKEGLLKALRDLKAEYDTGKLPATEYKQHKQRLMEHLIALSPESGSERSS